MKQRTLDDLVSEHGDIETKLDKVRELEAQLEMKNRQLFEYEQNFEILKKDFDHEKRTMTEEIEIEREKALKLQKIEV